jgi:hypothetical protein
VVLVVSPIERTILDNLQSLLACEGTIFHSDATRFQLTRLGWSYFVESGLLGRGAGTFEAAIAVDPSMDFFAEVTNAHNGLIEIAAQYRRSAFASAQNNRTSAELLHQRMMVLRGIRAFTASSLASSSVITSPW